MPSKKLKVEGFTLIELLITISIIAVLSAMALVVYSTVMKQGRDSKRQSDLRSIQSALEQYNSDQGYYPASLIFGSPLAGGEKTYMNTVPVGSPVYVYVGLPVATCGDGAQQVAAPQNCRSYCLMSQLDIPPSPALTFPADCTKGSNNFFVSPP